MKSSEASQSIPFRSKKALYSTPNSKSLNDPNSKSLNDPNSKSLHDPNLFCSPTPEKNPPELPCRSRNRNAALSIKEVKRSAESCHKSNQKKPRDLADKIDSARRQITSWPEESPSAKLKNDVAVAPKLPEKYEDLIELFNGLVNSIRILRLRGSMPTFTNICPCIARLTDRRFTYGMLAQIKYILPEVIEVKRVLLFDELTRCMKPDLHVSVKADAIINDNKLKFEGGNMNLKNVFRTRLIDYSQSHSEAPEIPGEVLPEPFNYQKQEVLPYKVRLSTSFSSSELALDQIPEGFSSKIKEDAHSNMAKVPETSPPMETSSELPIQQKPVIAAHLSQSFRRCFSHKARSTEEEGTYKNSPEFSFLSPANSVPKSSLNTISSSEDLSSAQPSILDTVAATPNKKMSSIKDEDDSPSSDAEQYTPAKLASTPARMMSVTPALRTPKTCHMSPDDDCANSPNKLTRRPPRPRSLKFDTPIKNKSAKDQKLENVSIDDEILDLPESLIQSIRDKEKKTMEEQDPAISQAKRRRQMIAFLPKLFNMIQFLFQSISRSVITKEELIHKIISGHSDIVDRKEVEEQLTLLLELAPDWISEKLSIGGDLLIRFDKLASSESIRRRLEEAR